MKGSITFFFAAIAAMLLYSCGTNEKKFRLHLENGIELIYKAQYAEAEAELNKALKQNPSSHEVLYYLGACRRSLGDIESAKQKFEESIKFNPNYAEPYLGLALIYQDIYQDRGMACYYFVKAEELGMKSLMDYTKWCR